MNARLLALAMAPSHGRTFSLVAAAAALTVIVSHVRADFPVCQTIHLRFCCSPRLFLKCEQKCDAYIDVECPGVRELAREIQEREGPIEFAQLPEEIADAPAATETPIVSCENPAVKWADAHEKFCCTPRLAIDCPQGCTPFIEANCPDLWDKLAGDAPPTVEPFLLTIPPSTQPTEKPTPAPIPFDFAELPEEEEEESTAKAVDVFVECGAQPPHAKIHAKFCCSVRLALTCKDACLPHIEENCPELWAEIAKLFAVDDKSFLER